MGMTIKYGGRILASFTTCVGTYAANEIWEEGRVLTLNSSGNLVIATDASKGVLGLALNYRRSAFDDQSMGIEGSKKQAIVMDTSIVETTVWASGVTMTAGDRLYVNSVGDLVNSASSANRPLGVVISVTAAGVQGASTMTALWSPLTNIV